MRKLSSFFSRGRKGADSSGEHRERVPLQVPREPDTRARGSSAVVPVLHYGDAGDADSNHDHRGRNDHSGNSGRRTASASTARVVQSSAGQRRPDNMRDEFQRELKRTRSGAPGAEAALYKTEHLVGTHTPPAQIPISRRPSLPQGAVAHSLPNAGGLGAFQPRWTHPNDMAPRPHSTQGHHSRTRGRTHDFELMRSQYKAGSAGGGRGAAVSVASTQHKNPHRRSQSQSHRRSRTRSRSNGRQKHKRRSSRDSRKSKRSQRSVASGRSGGAPRAKRAPLVGGGGGGAIEKPRRRRSSIGGHEMSYVPTQRAASHGQEGMRRLGQQRERSSAAAASFAAGDSGRGNARLPPFSPSTRSHAGRGRFTSDPPRYVASEPQQQHTNPPLHSYNYDAEDRWDARSMRSQPHSGPLLQRQGSNEGYPSHQYGREPDPTLHPFSPPSPLARPPAGFNPRLARGSHPFARSSNGRPIDPASGYRGAMAITPSVCDEWSRPGITRGVAPSAASAAGGAEREGGMGAPSAGYYPSASALQSARRSFDPPAPVSGPMSPAFVPPPGLVAYGGHTPRRPLAELPSIRAPDPPDIMDTIEPPEPPVIPTSDDELIRGVLQKAGVQVAPIPRVTSHRLPAGGNGSPSASNSASNGKVTRPLPLRPRRDARDDDDGDANDYGMVGPSSVPTAGAMFPHRRSGGPAGFGVCDRERSPSPRGAQHSRPSSRRSDDRARGRPHEIVEPPYSHGRSERRSHSRGGDRDRSRSRSRSLSRSRGSRPSSRQGLAADRRRSRTPVSGVSASRSGRSGLARDEDTPSPLSIGARDGSGSSGTPGGERSVPGGGGPGYGPPGTGYSFHPAPEEPEDDGRGFSRFLPRFDRLSTIPSEGGLDRDDFGSQVSAAGGGAANGNGTSLFSPRATSSAFANSHTQLLRRKSSTSLSRGAADAGGALDGEASFPDGPGGLGDSSGRRKPMHGPSPPLPPPIRNPSGANGRVGDDGGAVPGQSVPPMPPTPAMYGSHALRKASLQNSRMRPSTGPVGCREGDNDDVALRDSGSLGYSPSGKMPQQARYDSDEDATPRYSSMTGSRVDSPRRTADLACPMDDPSGLGSSPPPHARFHDDDDSSDADHRGDGDEDGEFDHNVDAPEMASVERDSVFDSDSTVPPAPGQHPPRPPTADPRAQVSLNPARQRRKRNEIELPTHPSALPPIQVADADSDSDSGSNDIGWKLQQIHERAVADARKQQQQQELQLELLREEGPPLGVMLKEGESDCDGGKYSVEQSPTTPSRSRSVSAMMSGGPGRKSPTLLPPGPDHEPYRSTSISTVLPGMGRTESFESPHRGRMVARLASPDYEDSEDSDACLLPQVPTEPAPAPSAPPPLPPAIAGVPHHGRNVVRHLEDFASGPSSADEVGSAGASGGPPPPPPSAHQPDLGNVGRVLVDQGLDAIHEDEEFDHSGDQAVVRSSVYPPAPPMSA